MAVHYLNRFARGAFYLFFTIADLVLILLVWFIIAVTIDTPSPADTGILALERREVSPGFYTLKNNWLKQSDSGLWEIYVEGDGFERGVVEGKLGKELAEKQEIAFVNQIRKMIPSEKMLNYLKFFIAFFNRNLDEFVPLEYKEEIYGESLFASDEFDFMAPKYYRMLNYHAAHDIGHALQDKNMTVGCTSFGVWGEKTADTGLLIGRNFDFYVGDEFAEDKLIYFVKPAKGYRLMMVSWAGMIGTVSGMNEKGLTVTINASKSEIPTGAATPISIVAREILQYAKNIDEAFAIAQSRKTFVSESILIGSREDGRSATIEKTPSYTGLFESPDRSLITCSNHYRGKYFEKDLVNMKNMEESSSNYRLEHLSQLLSEKDKLSVEDAAAILRNREGMNGKNIGMGNEKALNQLIAHHSVIFRPEQLQVWVSTQPFQLGKFICYDLDSVFSAAPALNVKKELYVRALTIPEDPFVKSREFMKFNAWKRMREAFRFAEKNELTKDLTQTAVEQFIACNPEYFETYTILGNYYRDRNEEQHALKYYTLALRKEITTLQDRRAIEQEILELLKSEPAKK